MKSCEMQVQHVESSPGVTSANLSEHNKGTDLIWPRNCLLVIEFLDTHTLSTNMAAIPVMPIILLTPLN